MYLIKCVCAVLSFLLTIPSVIPQGIEQMKKDIESQKVRIEELAESYKAGEYQKVDEAQNSDFNYNQAIDEGVKFNEMRFIGTHNSYQTRSIDAVNKIYYCFFVFEFWKEIDQKGFFNSETLTEQLNNGIRSLEIDIETKKDKDDISFICTHSPYLDMTTNSYDFALALKEIKMWSDNNPDHLPVTIIIEPKKTFLTFGGLKKFNINYANEFDRQLREYLGDTLIEPSDVLQNYNSFKEMREDDAWPEVKDLRGKVMVLLHDTTVTEDYISQDESIHSQAMFPMLRYDDRNKDYASFILDNSPTSALKHSKELCEDLKLIVRTKVDSFMKISKSDRTSAFDSYAQIISTDYPPKTFQSDYVLSFDNNKTIGLVGYSKWSKLL